MQGWLQMKGNEKAQNKIVLNKYRKVIKPMQE